MEGSVMDPRERVKALIAESRAIVNGAEAAGRGQLTDDEQRRIKRLLDEAKPLQERIVKEDASRNLLAQLDALPLPPGASRVSGGGAKTLGEVADATAEEHQWTRDVKTAASGEKA